MANQSVKDQLNDPITKHMKTEIARIQIDKTVEESLAYLRQNAPENRIIYFYVVDEQNRLCGVVPTRRLLLSMPEAIIRDIMVKQVISIPMSATVLDACEFFIFHRYLAFPIVDEQNQLVGIVDVDLYTEELADIDQREGNDQLFQLIGVHLTEVQQKSSLKAFQSRFPWLIANIVGGILAAFLSGIFEAELQKAVALALFIPVVLALAESVSIQSVSLSLQVLRGKQPTLREIVKKLRGELFTGLFLGIACALAIATVALIWLGQMNIVLCLLGGIIGGVTFAAIVGVAIPNLLRWMQREPQVAAGPIALAASDMATLVLYFSLARVLV